MEIDINRDNTVTLNLTPKELEEIGHALSGVDLDGHYLNAEVFETVYGAIFDALDEITERT